MTLEVCLLICKSEIDYEAWEAVRAQSLQLTPLVHGQEAVILRIALKHAKLVIISLEYVWFELECPVHFVAELALDPVIVN